MKARVQASKKQAIGCATRIGLLGMTWALPKILLANANSAADAPTGYASRIVKGRHRRRLAHLG